LPAARLASLVLVVLVLLWLVVVPAPRPLVRLPSPYLRLLS